MITISLSDIAYESIKEKILFEENNNRHLSVRKTAQEFNMSYTPVREAFKRLERDGLLERIPNVGYLIPRISNRNIEEIFQARECLEVFVLKKVFDSLNEDSIKILEDYIQKQKEAIKNEKFNEFYNHDKEFHLYFFKVYNNSHLMEMIKNIRERYLLCSLTTISESQDGVTEAIQEHIDIVENIKKGNKQGAVNSLIANIINSQKRLKKGNISIN